jgi:hypothetical protein
MKHFINHIKQNAAFCSVLFCSIFSYKNTTAQYNFINNYSFELYTQCPKVLNAPPKKYWYLATNSGPVYANSCDTSIYCSVPNNYIKNKNFQYAHTGNAYIFLDYVNGGGRGYLQSKLKDSLKYNKRYYIEFFINIPNSLKFACNNVALLLTNTAVYVDTLATPYGVLPANPQVYNYGNPVLGDTLNWTKVSAIYKAQGGEQFITLGNFKNDANTTLKQIQPTGYYGAGYIIDDVSVIPLDSMQLKADAGKDTTITLVDSVFIGSYTNGIDSLKWQIQTTGTTIDSTRPGFWVHPTGYTCYVLTQTVNGYTSSDTVCISVGTVPLKFISYNINETRNGINEKQVTSNWTTANEINVSHFNIQRSLSRSIGSKDFITIGKIAANNKSYNQYLFTDGVSAPSPLGEGWGEAFYRIESVDKDGRKQYSTTQQINTKHQIPNIAVFPNPAKNTVNVVSSNMKEISIFDMQGKLIITQICSYDNIVTLKLNNVNTGLYLVKVINSKGETKNAKLIIE